MEYCCLPLGTATTDVTAPSVNRFSSGDSPSAAVNPYTNKDLECCRSSWKAGRELRRFTVAKLIAKQQSESGSRDTSAAGSSPVSDRQTSRVFTPRNSAKVRSARSESREDLEERISSAIGMEGEIGDGVNCEDKSGAGSRLFRCFLLSVQMPADLVRQRADVFKVLLF
jgi:hypothetical protein